ncbi:GIY-YIG nuclease family protein [Enterobacteriaceae bacterium ML5]|nr:GIY-YIG nuclease family protein [Enterobacteriaceae bacterium ML5]
MAVEPECVNTERYRFIREELHRLEMKHGMPINVSMPLPEKLNSHGWVYILSNPFMPGLLKIGMTTTSPQTRCKELSSGTNVPASFEIEASFFSADPRKDEASIHAALAEYRVNGAREFFKCHLSAASEICRDICLCEASSSMQDLANGYDAICLDPEEKVDLHEWFEEFGLCVVGPKANIAKVIFELGAYQLDEIRKDGVSLILEEGYTTGIMTEETQNFLAYLEESHEKALATGIYGPQQPGGF